MPTFISLAEARYLKWLDTTTQPPSNDRPDPWLITQKLVRMQRLTKDSVCWHVTAKGKKLYERVLKADALAKENAEKVARTLFPNCRVVELKELDP